MHHTPEFIDDEEFDLTTRGYNVELDHGKVVVSIPMRQILGRHGEVTDTISIHQQKTDGTTLVIGVVREGRKNVRLVIQDPEEEQNIPE